MRTNIWQSFGRRSNLIPFASCCVFAAGNTDSFPPSSESLILLVPTRLVAWATKPSKDTSSTELRSDVEAGRSLSLRVSCTESPRLMVSTNSRTREALDASLRREPDAPLDLSVSWTLIGLTKTPPTSITKLSSSIPSTEPSVRMPASTGSATPPTSTERCVVSPPPESKPEVWDKRETTLPSPVLLAEPTGREEILLYSVVTGKLCRSLKGYRLHKPSFCHNSCLLFVQCKPVFFWLESSFSG